MEKYNLLQVPSCVSSSQYIYILYKFLFFSFFFRVFFCWFWSAARDQYHIESDQIKSTKRPSSFQMAFYPIRFEHWNLSSFCDPKYYLKSRFSTLWHNFRGRSGCYSTSQERPFPLRSHANSEHFTLVLLFKPEILFDNLLLFPLTQEFAIFLSFFVFFPPFLHSQLNNIKEGKALRWNEIMKSVTRNGSSEHSSVFP